MTNDNNKPGADAPGEKKSFVPRPVEQQAVARAPIPAGTGAHRASTNPPRRQAEAVVDPHLDEAASWLTTQTPIGVLPPEAVVRLVLFAGRMAKKQGKRLPPNIADRLGEALARGDATAPALRDWTLRIGVLADRPGITPARIQDTETALLGDVRAMDQDRVTTRAVMLARHLRERLGMYMPALRAKAERKASRGSRPATLSDSGDASPTVSNDTGRRS